MKPDNCYTYAASTSDNADVSLIMKLAARMCAYDAGAKLTDYSDHDEYQTSDQALVINAYAQHMSVTNETGASLQALQSEISENVAQGAFKMFSTILNCVAESGDEKLNCRRFVRDYVDYVLNAEA